MNKEDLKQELENILTIKTEYEAKSNLQKLLLEKSIILDSLSELDLNSNENSNIVNHILHNLGVKTYLISLYKKKILSFAKNIIEDE